jgi:hypothetical protein
MATCLALVLISGPRQQARSIFDQPGQAPAGQSAPTPAGQLPAPAPAQQPSAPVNQSGAPAPAGQ